jgi:hypothetical protein
MAAETLATIASALATLFDDDMTTSINRAVVLTQLLPIKPATSYNCNWDVRFGTATPGTAVIADGADVSVYNADSKVPATLAYGTYHDAFSLSGKALAGAMITGNPAVLEDLYQEEIEESVERLASAVGTGFYSGSGAANYIHGLTAANGPLLSTGTYANIDRSSYTQWASNVDANGGIERPLSLSLMRKMRRTIYTACGLKPDLIVCDPLTHEYYGSLIGTDRRYLQDVRLRGSVISLDGGYNVLEFDGIPVVEDKNCTAGSMLFLNTRHCFIRYLPTMPDMINQSPGMVDLHGTPEEQLGQANRLQARINYLARTGDAYKFQLIMYPQLQVKRCNAMGQIQDLRTT